MPQDYAKPSTSRKPAPRKRKATTGKSKKPHSGARKKLATKKRTSASPTLIVLTVALLSGFSFGIYKLSQVDATSDSSVVTNQTNNKTQEQQYSSEQARQKKFDFYDLLPKTEVVAPDVQEYEFVARDAEQSYYYQVQAGSFKNYADADRQKAELAIQGLPTSIQKTQSQSGQVWYRVNVGPFHERSSMNGALDKLVAMNIKPLTRKIKK